MALPDLDALKAYLKIDNTVEDGLLAALLASARALVEAYVERPLTLELRTYVDPAETFVAYGRVVNLRLLDWPIHPGDVLADPPIAAPAITDGDGVVVDAGLYAVDSRSGMFIANVDESFYNGPYMIVASVGLAAFTNYATTIEPILSQAILDVASDLYSNRTPSASNETAGGGAAVTWRPSDGSSLPPRTTAMLRAFKPIGVA